MGRRKDRGLTPSPSPAATLSRWKRKIVRKPGRWRGESGLSSPDGAMYDYAFSTCRAVSSLERDWGI